jgi:hypothetical protein
MNSTHITVKDTLNASLPRCVSKHTDTPAICCSSNFSQTMTTTTYAGPTTLSQLSKLDFSENIPQETLKKVLSAPPFKQIPGAFNFRDLGLIGDAPYVQPGLLYRSGSLAYITEAGKRQLISDLGVNLILDLRSESECKVSPEPEVERIKAVWFPCEKDPKPLDIRAFVGGGEQGYSDHYLEILDVYAPSIKHALNYVKDEARENKALLFHCTGEFTFFFFLFFFF